MRNATSDRNRPSWMTAAASRMMPEASCDAESVDRSDNIGQLATKHLTCERARVSGNISAMMR